MIVRIANLKPSTSVAVGATLGERHCGDIRAAIANKSFPAGEIVIFDFANVKSTNGSYLKATALWLLVCGQLWARPNFGYVGNGNSPRPYDVYCAFANLDSEVAEEVRDFFFAREMPILIATKWSSSAITSATVEGRLEPMLSRTLSLLTQCGAGSAPDLHKKHRHEGISVTAWNNRLADLYALRLIRRVRDGKQWIYKPIANTTTYG